MKTFRHRGVVLAAKMNDTHVVSCCDRGMVKVWHVETYLLIKVKKASIKAASDFEKTNVGSASW